MNPISQHEAAEVRFAQRMKAVRGFRQLDQAGLAVQVGVPRSAISDIERLQRAVKLGEALAICDVLQVPLADMLGDGPLDLTVTTRVAA